jgi:hypothetical protein
MTTGLSGSYAFNGTNFTLQPTSGRWLPRDAIGIDGAGHMVYPGVREFELVWSLQSVTDARYLIDVFNTVSNTGTAVSCLPKYGDAQYLFYNYSGTIPREPEFGEYFEEHPSSVRLIIGNIKI